MSVKLKSNELGGHMVFVIDLWAECWLVTAREWAASQEFKIFVSDKLIKTKEFNSFFHNQPAGWLPLRRFIFGPDLSAVYELQKSCKECCRRHFSREFALNWAEETRFNLFKKCAWYWFRMCCDRKVGPAFVPLSSSYVSSSSSSDSCYTLEGFFFFYITLQWVSLSSSVEVRSAC